MQGAPRSRGRDALEDVLNGYEDVHEYVHVYEYVHEYVYVSPASPGFEDTP